MAGSLTTLEQEEGMLTVDPAAERLLAMESKALQAAQPLLVRGSPNLQNRYVNTVLFGAVLNYHLATERLLAVEDEVLEEAQNLLSSGNPNLQNKYGNTVLIGAVINHHQRVVKVLLDGGADPNIQGYERMTALIHAAKSGQEDIVDLMLSYKHVDPNLQDFCGGNTALIRAAQMGHVDIVKMLLNCERTDPTIKDKDDYTAYMWALKNDHKEVANILQPYLPPQL